MMALWSAKVGNNEVVAMISRGFYISTPHIGGFMWDAVAERRISICRMSSPEFPTGAIVAVDTFHRL